MYQRKGYKKAQSLIEYVVLLSVVLGALVLMSAYIKRAYSGRIKEDADGLGAQYAPKHTASRIETTLSTTSESCTGGNCRGVPIPDGMTVTWTNSSSSFDRKEAIDSFATE